MTHLLRLEPSTRPRPAPPQPTHSAHCGHARHSPALNGRGRALAQWHCGTLEKEKAIACSHRCCSGSAHVYSVSAGGRAGGRAGGGRITDRWAECCREWRGVYGSAPAGPAQSRARAVAQSPSLPLRRTAGKTRPSPPPNGRPSAEPQAAESTPLTPTRHGIPAGMGTKGPQPGTWQKHTTNNRRGSHAAKVQWNGVTCCLATDSVASDLSSSGTTRESNAAHSRLDSSPCKTCATPDSTVGTD
jgi:hypothetical protein